MSRRLVWLLPALLLASPAVARMHAGPSQLSAGHRLQGAIAPLDGGGSFSTPAAAYSLRRLMSTYAGPAIKLRRASDNATQDINFLGFTGFTGAPIDTAAANAFCASTTCWFDTWYDQSGLGRNVTQASLPDQPQYIASCANGLPCGRITTGYSGGMGSVALSPAGPLSFSAINTFTGTGCYLANWGNHNLLTANTDVQLHGSASSTFNGAAASQGVAHVYTGVLNGAASVLRVDVAETTGTVSTDTVAGAIGFVGVPGSTCDEQEMIIWNTYALTAGERAALRANQQSYFGTP